MPGCPALRGLPSVLAMQSWTGAFGLGAMGTAGAPPLAAAECFFLGRHLQLG